MISMETAKAKSGGVINSMPMAYNKNNNKFVEQKLND